MASHGTKNLLRHLHTCPNRELLSYLNPNVKHISRNTAKSDVVKVYEKEKRNLKSNIMSLSSRICLTSDLWTSVTTDHYMTVTAHYIDENWELHAKVLCFSYMPPPYNGAILLEKLQTLLREWGIERKIFSITLDNASYNDSMLIDSNFLTCPSPEDWVRAKKIAFLLQPFYDISSLFSGVRYPTANLYFYGVWNSEDVAIRSMAMAMLKKFEKYWKCYSVVLSFVDVLDPCYKLHLLEFCYSKLEMDDHVEFVRSIREKLYILFDEYVTSTSRDDRFASSISQGNILVEDIVENIGDNLDEYDAFESEHFGSQSTKSQLDLYLEEPRVDRKKFSDLNVLDYWKANSHRYPELSLMTRDILSIPITTIASEFLTMC
ncbi:hypothetical protein EUGRSUZ_K00995 [Eucalyptus grandis]|uniref:Uncharacterized protein n=2 Tax=Eucalyptus grandis TaxID=71139 RepID=A0ACC3IS29_EUCGR|nr:hypothetical protein EUGRSUZ_K00995 [Eucalyptus grandis]